MEILKEMKAHGIDIADARAKLHCQVFEDNSGALEMARVHKFRPQTKHLNVKITSLSELCGAWGYYYPRNANDGAIK